MTSSPATVSKAALCAAVALSFHAMACADIYVDVDEMIRAGKLQDALSRAEQYLAATPRDPRMRLLKGVALANQSRTAEAIMVFTRLTEEYPELPEPYNNIGVLYATQNQLDRARSTLELALVTSPRYAAAYENLGDVHMRMAAQAFAKAAAISSANARLQPKLSALRELVSTPGMQAVALSSVPAFGTNVPAAPISAKLPTPIAPAPLTAAAPPPVAERLTSSRVASLAQALDRAPDLGGDAQEIRKMVEGWATAWAAKDLGRYLSAYSADFRTPGLSRKDWEEQRRARILGKSHITVKLNGVMVALAGSTATVKFRQEYAGDGLLSTNQKTLEMAKVAGRWVITRESAGG